MDHSNDHHRVLGVPRDASPSRIRKAYKNLARIWHPDKNLDRREIAEAQFKRISKAYETLSGQRSKTSNLDHRSRASHPGKSSDRDRDRPKRDKYDERFFTGETAEEASASKKRSQLLDSISRINTERMEGHMAETRGRSVKHKKSEIYVRQIFPEKDDDSYERIVLDRLKSKGYG